jgi:beta-barrel assembly-enhancing protease
MLPRLRFIFVVFFLSGLVLTQAGLGSFLKKLVMPVLDVSEKILGEAVAASVRLQYGVMKLDPETSKWVQSTFDKIVKVSDRKGVSYKLTVIKPGFVNAFAVPGGHIFVTKGLLQRVKSDDELAGVLGHEVGHIVARHSMNNIKHQILYQAIISQMRKRSKNLEKLGFVYSLFAGMRYSRKNEQESDYIGARYLAKAGYNPEGMLRFLEILKSLEKRDPSRIETSLRTHPPSKRRVAKMAEFVASFPDEIRNRPMSLSLDFVKKYPPPKKKHKHSKDDKKPDEKKTVTEKLAKLTLVYRQDFDLTSSVPGVAKGLRKSQAGGIFILDKSTRFSGEASQRFTSYHKDRVLALVTPMLNIKGGQSYRLRGRVKALGLNLGSDPMGVGLRVNLSEFSARSMTKAHLGVGELKSDTKKFREVLFEFKTHPKSTRLTLEFSFRKSSGQAWFDEFQLEELSN